nr:sugar transferase [Bifidobacterium samirii]
MRQAQASRVLYWRFFVNLALMLCDMAMFVIGMTVVLTLLGATGTLPSERFSADVNLNAFTVISAIVWVLCLRGAGLYHRHVMGDGYEVNAKLIDGAIRSWICLSALAYVLDLRLTLVGLTLGVAAGLLLTIAERVVSRMVITRHRSRGAYSYATVVVGSPEGIARTLRFLSRKQQLNYRPVAVCPIRLDKRTGLVVADDDADALRRSVLDHWPEMSVIRYGDRELAETFVRRQIQTVMVSDVMTRFSDNFNTFSVRMETLGLEIALIASAADAAGHETQVRSLHGTTILTLRLSQYAPTVAFAKRVFDLVVSALAIVCSLIVTLPVAIAIKLTDGGPVFYTQTRIGRRGRPFQMIKFRSMVTNADELKAKLAAETGQEDRFIFKMKDDPRITKVGKFIRRFSIDELPQFLNVFKGDMSVVGPRPPLPEEYARYNQVYATRMLVKPGITGPWQVSGRSDLSAEESEQLDVAYVQNWSIIGDVILMFRTVGAVLGHKGAY